MSSKKKLNFDLSFLDRNQVEASFKKLEGKTNQTSVHPAQQQDASLSGVKNILLQIVYWIVVVFIISGIRGCVSYIFNGY